MQFSAQGYAQLNEPLKPDIAVLEGGYSIKGALPYVNLGICLAMAGCDYSAVREPDYNAAALREEPDTLDYIKHTCAQLLEGYFHPPWEISRNKASISSANAKSITTPTVSWKSNARNSRIATNAGACA